MKEFVFEALFNISLVTSVFTAIIVIFVKFYFNNKYSILLREHTSNININSEENSLLNFFYLFELMAPIFISNREVENENEEIKKTGGMIRILLYIFYFCFSHFLIAGSLFASN